MNQQLTYDKDGKKVPSKEFLFTMKIIVKKARTELDSPVQEWLDSFNAKDYDELYKAIHKLLADTYPEVLQ